MLEQINKSFKNNHKNLILQKNFSFLEKYKIIQQKKK